MPYKHVILLLVFTTCLRFSLIPQNTILWSVKSATSDKVSFLLGTFHQVGNSFVDSLPQIRENLLKSDLAVFESIDSQDRIISLLNARPDDLSYRSVLRKKDTEFLETYASQWPVALSKLSPLQLLLKLQKEYFTANCGTIKKTDRWDHFDKYLMHVCRENNKNLIGLETDSLQMVDINNAGQAYSWQVAKDDIHSWIVNIQESRNKRTICHNANEYMAFKFDYQFDQKCSPGLAIKQRNDKWIGVIMQHIADKSLFITVGLMHLYGDCGLIMQLRSRGFTVEPVDLTTGKNK